ncbi:MAG: acetyl-CoA hydrolase [Alphaproteobacteria bacterium]|nr:acetyl-CoA hydrolase [Alphaproteobacteria bacterium]
MSGATLTIDALAAEIAARIGGARRVFLPMGPAEPLALHAAFARAPQHAAGLTFVAVPLAGVNATDWTRLAPDARLETTMLSPGVAEAWRRGAVRLRPVNYRDIPRLLEAEPVDCAIAHVAPPKDGRASLGVSADLTPAALATARLKIAIVNPAMPVVADAPTIALADMDLVATAEAPLAEMPDTGDGADAAVEAIARAVADLVADGDVIQVGVGKLPSAILARLAARRNLRVHSGLLSAAHLALVRAGAIADVAGALTAGTILADATSLRALAGDPRVRLRPVDVTHDHAVLAALPRFTSINAALEVDLLGQINAEFAGARQISGVGGMADFVRGAAAAPGGRAIIALQASGKGGVSRVVARLASPAVTLARTDAPIVVTEYGVADLRGADVDARAVRLAAVAPPDARDGLQEAWREVRVGL